MSSLEEIQQSLDRVVESLFDTQTIVIVLLVLVTIFLLNKLVGLVGTRVIKFMFLRSENHQSSEKLERYRHAETTLNIITATVKIIVIVIGAVILWRLLSPQAGSAAAIGASALFIVLAGATISPLLRDITAGSVMIAERWYGVGDYITVEPFLNIQGVVEQVTLRSTKLRGLSGEVIWMHNQHIQAVKVKYRGTTNIALDVFVKDKARALKLLEGVMAIIPKGPMMVVDGLRITEEEQLTDTMWRIELQGKTVPGREWMVERFAVEAITEADLQQGGEKTIVYGPIARYVDSSAERRFKRAIKK